MTKDKQEYKSIVQRLKDLQDRIAYLEFAKGLLMTAGLAISIFWFLLVLTLATWPEPAVRIVIDLSLAAVLAITLYLVALRPLHRKRGFLQIARLLESHYGKFQARLIGALELYDKMVDIDFFSYPRFFHPKLEGDVIGEVTPFSIFYLEYRDGSRVKVVQWNTRYWAPEDTEYQNLKELASLIIELIQDKPKYQKLPEPTAGYV